MDPVILEVVTTDCGNRGNHPQKDDVGGQDVCRQGYGKRGQSGDARDKAVDSALDILPADKGVCGFLSIGVVLEVGCRQFFSRFHAGDAAVYDGLVALLEKGRDL